MSNMPRYSSQVVLISLGGLAHVAFVFAFIFSFVTVSGYSFSIDSFVGGGVPIAVLFVLGAVCSILYFSYNLYTPVGIILLFDISFILGSSAEVWTDRAPAGPPSFYSLYIFFFVIPLSIAVLMGGIEYWTRAQWRAEAAGRS